MTRLALQAAGLAAKTKRGGPHRKKRERRPLPGMLLFQDGSTHRWIPALDHDFDLVVTLDDATGAIYLVVRETEFCGLRLAGEFRRRTRENGQNSVRRPRHAALSDRNCEGFCVPGNSVRFAGTGWWAMQGSN